MRLITSFLLECLGYAIGYGFIGVLLFLPYGILGLVLTGDPTGTLFFAGIGYVIGAPIGIGEVFAKRFSPQPPREPPDGKTLFRMLLGFYLGPLLPPWWRVVVAGRMLAEKDFSRQQPGRWKRAVVGALACILLMSFLNLAVDMPADIPVWLLTLGIGAVLGGVAGALTDSI